LTGIKQFLDERRSCISYYLSCPATETCAVIDPSDQVEQYIKQADAEFVRITHVIDTHIHADHVTGARALSKITGAPIYMHESADVKFDFEPLKEGDAIKVGNVSLKPLFTPGHTKESMSLLYVDHKRAEVPWAVFTGDALFVGDIGRLDLVGAGTPAQMFDSLSQKLLSLADYVEIYPAHYVGSVCGTSMSLKIASTIGFERKFNPAIHALNSLEEFGEFLENNKAPNFPEHVRIKRENMGFSAKDVEKSPVIENASPIYHSR
jgi:hydroxyacylglutathione hydrolase